jgi:lipopolysaccharide cholinephosphotransferase
LQYKVLFAAQAMDKQMTEPRALSKNELRALQSVLLETLTEIDCICGKHGVKYSIDGGTLLGAVRHKGFIPWDDDLDIVMMRSEYEKLREVCKTKLDAGKYFFQDETTDPEYRWGYGRIRRIDSDFVRCGQEHLKMRTGIFLDIFPRDNVPDFYPVRLAHAFYCFFWRKVLYSEVGKVGAKNAVVKLIYKAINVIPASFAFKRLERLRERMNKRRTKLVRCYTFQTPRNKRFGYPRAWFEEFTEHEFEGQTFPGSRDWCAYLTYVYGDYMKLPSPEQRRQHPCSKFKLPEGYDI